MTNTHNERAPICEILVMNLIVLIRMGKLRAWTFEEDWGVIVDAALN